MLSIFESCIIIKFGPNNPIDINFLEVKKVKPAEIKEKWKQTNIQKIAEMKRACRRLTKRGLKNRIIFRPKNCSKCGNKGEMHSHHPDYTKPFEICWLCKLCHMTLHGMVHTIKN